MEEKRLLVIAPHPDDEILGAGGTIAKYTEMGFRVTVLTVAGHRPPVFTEEVYRRTVAEARAAHQIVGVQESVFLDVPATMVSDLAIHELNGKISTVVSEVKPHIVLVPYPDRHIDHRAVFDSALVATRPIKVGKDIELLAAYETLSETHWNAPHIEPNFVPNWVVDISEYLKLKVQALSCYKSQIAAFPGPRSTKAIEALATFRGTQAGFAHGEALQIIRMCT